jgi:DsbC/DsbD-like thiol-disulfide interchange protein
MVKTVAGLFLLAAAILTQQQPPPTPIRWTAQAPSESVKAGENVTVSVTAVMDEGWHLYALDPIEGGPIPTKITAGPAPSFTLQEKDIEKPEPKRSHDPNFGVETAYYDGSATFGLPIKVATDVPAGVREFEVAARFQACNDQFCLRPQTASMKIKIKVSR